MDRNPEKKQIRTVCKECKLGCDMIVVVENGRAVSVKEDPSSPKHNNRLCWRAQAALERLYHPQRLQYPLKRAGKKGEGKWQRISWGEALDIISNKFLSLKQSHGPEATALIKGHYERRCDLISRMGNAFGTPNIAGIDNTCYIPSASGRLITYGFDGRPDFTGRPDCIMSWGSGIDVPIEKGAKLIVVNSLMTEAAKKADLWLQPRPATDLALALGIINVIINEELYNKDFVDNWTVGFEKLKNHVQGYPPEKVSGITWIPAEKIIEAARLFASYDYACLQTGNASEDTYNSTQFARAVSIIQAICGCLDIPGGTVDSTGTPLDFEGRGFDVLRHIITPEQESKKLGAEKRHFPTDPLWDSIANKPAELQFQYLLDSILQGEPYRVQAAMVMGCNPVITWGNSKRVYNAFKEIDFLAVADLFMTPTACMADIVLPAASYLESDAVLVKNMSMGDTYIQAQQKAIQLGECRSDFDIIISLARRLGLENYFWENSGAYLDDYLSAVGINYKELCRRNILITSGMRYRKYLEKGFNTPSGKVELYSSLCEKWGYEPLPYFHEPKETPLSEPEAAEQYPLILTSAHDSNYVHSQDRNLETIRKQRPEPLVSIHPETARNLGIDNGDTVFIENKRGRIKQKAVLSETVDPKVISVDYGWWFPEKADSECYGWDEANLNILTDDNPPFSPEIGSPAMRGFFCKVYKAE